jgi:hypothetical protein
MSVHQYNKFSAEQLRQLLNNFDEFDKDISKVSFDMEQLKTKIFDKNIPPIIWATLYEKPFPECMAIFILSIGAQQDIKDIASSEDQLGGLDNLVETMDNRLDGIHASKSTKADKDGFVADMVALSMLMAKSMQCLVVYGVYINDLIKIARESNDHKLADKSLLKAIRIDPSVLSCPTAMNRISQATLCNDEIFFNKLKNAITGKLGAREIKNFQKMRFVLQLLHESGGVNLTDNELKELFVEILDLYSDPQFTSEKNLKEFTYNFKQQKSTI